ncbi:hypothetical protein [Massilia sp. METH4]|uniref:hypothetical protein n=1 Tax=Massilia sp. METH4 TaxID=3123041 RepID=UPI0030D3D94B
MNIDRVVPSTTVMSIPDRVARDRPGGQLPHARLAAPGQQVGSPTAPGGIGALLDAMNGDTVAAAAAGKLALESLLGATSMQPNQLFMARQVVMHTPEPSAMALSWMAMIRTHAEQRNALLAQAHGRHVPASLFLSGEAPQVLRDGRLPAQLVAELDAWRFAVQGWGAEKLVLRVVTRDDDADGKAPQPRRQARVALRLELHLPQLGKVVLQLEPAAGGVVLEIGAVQADAMAHMRARLPELGAIARRCGVQILRVRLMRELSGAGLGQPGRMQIAMLTPPLFKLMAEWAVLLAQPRRGDEAFYEP